MKDSRKRRLNLAIKSCKMLGGAMLYGISRSLAEHATMVRRMLFRQTMCDIFYA